MYLWRRLVAPKWLEEHADALRALVGDRLVVVEWPSRRSVMLEVVCLSRKEACEIVQGFGGRIVKLPRDWLKVYAREQARPPLRIGKRLVVVGEDAPVGEAASFPGRAVDLGEGKLAASPTDSRKGASHLVIPAGAAFGTGGHATTAMTLRFLEEMTRLSKNGWAMVDLGTGSGILALAARSLGAGRVEAVDNDLTAIATARANARLNKIRGIHFVVGDVRRWRPGGPVAMVTANLFSELLIEVLPRIARYLEAGGSLIVSGILRVQERDVRRALKRNGFAVSETRRRGKWIAMRCSK